MEYLKSIFFIIYFICSIVGLGWYVFKILSPKNQYVNSGILACLGLSVLITIGGFLNYFHNITLKFIFAILLIGTFNYFLYIKENGVIIIQNIIKIINMIKEDKILFIIVIIYLLIFFLQLFVTLSSNEFNLHDDLQGYFVFAEKIKQTGFLGADPYSERRLISSLGGKYFLDAILLFALSWQNLHIMDRVVGLVVLLMMVSGIFSTINVSMRLKTLFLISLVLIIPPTVNITALCLATSLFFALFYFYHYYEFFNVGFKRAIGMALLLSALISLKTSFLPPAFAVISAFYFNQFIFVNNKRQTNIIFEYVICILLAFIFLLPWMLAMHQSSGTLMYPLLGLGFHGSVYGTFLKPNSEFGFSNFTSLAGEFLNPIFAFWTFVVFGLMKSKMVCNNYKKLLPHFVLFLAVIAIAFSTGGYGVMRFTFPFIFAISIYSLIEILHQENNGLNKSEKFGKYLLFYFIGSNLSIFLAVLPKYNNIIKFNLNNSILVSKTEKMNYFSLQSVIPKGETLLVRLNHNYLLDFKRNLIYIADYPGGSSPPPGMPFFKGPDLLSEYLINKKIRYIAYSYREQANFAKEIYVNRLDKKTNAWIRTEAQHTFDFQDNILLLSKTRKILFDDGENFVIDLNDKKSVQERKS